MYYIILYIILYIIYIYNIVYHITLYIYTYDHASRDARFWGNSRPCLRVAQNFSHSC